MLDDEVDETNEHREQEYRRWLEKLDSGSYDLTDWEVKFVSDLLAGGVHTTKQKKKILDLVEKYL